MESKKTFSGVGLSKYFFDKCEKEKRIAFNSFKENFENDVKKCDEYRCFLTSSEKNKIYSINKDSFGVAANINLSMHKDKLTEVISKQSPLIIQMMQSNEISVCVATLQEMLEKGMHSNVTIWVGKEQFLAHKNLLCARSHYFNAMLQIENRWKETTNNVITLNDISPKTFAVLLCHLYGVFVDWPCESNAFTYNIVQSADMLGLDDFKYAISFCLQRGLCHFFHKPCSGCTDGVSFVLLITYKFNMPNLFNKCMRWSIKHMVRVCTTKAFSELPSEIFDDFSKRIIASITLSSVVDTALKIDGVLGRLPEVKWAKSVFSLLTDLMLHCQNYIVEYLHQLTSSKKIYSLFQGMSFKQSIAEELGHSLTSTLIPSNACSRYLAIQNLLSCSQNEYWCQEAQEILKNALDRSWHYLLENCYAVMHSDDWRKFPDKEKKLLKENAINAVDSTRKLKQKPILSSSKTRPASNERKKIASKPRNFLKSTKTKPSKMLDTSYNLCSKSLTNRMVSCPEVTSEIFKSEKPNETSIAPQLLLKPVMVTEELSEEICISSSELIPYCLQDRMRYVNL